MKEIKELLEEQLALFQSEKEGNIHDYIMLMVRKIEKENTKQDSKGTHKHKFTIRFIYIHIHTEIVKLERSLLEKIEKRDEEIQLLKLQLASYQEEKEDEEESFAKEIEKLHSATDRDESK